jgi:hypothetical protein
MMNPSFVTATQGLRGWFATMFSWVPMPDGGFYEPYESSPHSYPTKDEAMGEAHDWAASEGLECR